MSPSCVATIFEGDNGGRTSPGVDDTEIRIGVPVWAGYASTASYQSYRDATTALFEFVNRRFEFYGRRLAPVYVEGATSDAVTGRAMATQVASEKVFAAVTGLEDIWHHPQAAFVQELARNQVVTIARGAGTWWSDRVVFDALHPFVWSVYPSSEQLQRNLGALACTLVDKPVRFSGDVSLRQKPRRIAVLSAGQQVAPPVDVLLDTLAGCSTNPARLTWVQASDTSSTSLRSGLSQLKADGVTTVICVCQARLGVSSVPSSAGTTVFQPEWLLAPSSAFSDEQYTQSFRTSFGAAGPIQLQAGPKLIHRQQRPWFWALTEINPTLATSSDGNVAMAADALYNQLLVLAAGIQGAGPTLTPETFAQSLLTTQFPNPGAGQAPYWQPSVGFGPGDHSFYSDYAVAWWSDDPTLEAYEPFAITGRGTWCYVGTGARYTPGRYPTDVHDRLFSSTQPCR